MKYKEQAERCSNIIKEIAIEIDNTENAFNTHSQDICNDALQAFYTRVRIIIYGTESEEGVSKRSYTPKERKYIDKQLAADEE